MAAWKKVAGIVLVILGVIVVLSSSVVMAGEEILWTGTVIQVVIGAALILAGIVLLVLPRKRS